MIIIIGDIGNTYTKICIINGKNFKVSKKFNFRTQNFTEKYFQKNILSKFNNPSHALFASVVPKIFNKIKKNLKRKSIITKELKNKKLNKIVKIKLNKPQQVGSDRIANAVGVFKYFKSNCIVVDFGTATTFDVISKKGLYIGGMIAPGIDLSIRNLNKHTSNLPSFRLKNKKNVIGKNTLDALSSGFIWGYQGLIENIISKINAETKINHKIIFTGGYASLFSKFLKKKVIVDKNLTINGVIEIYKMNKQKFK